MESVSVGRNVGVLKQLLEDRTRKLVALEVAWKKYVGNPVSKDAKEAGYDRHRMVADILHSQEGREEGAHQSEVMRINEEGGRLVELSQPPSPSPVAGSFDVEAGNHKDDKFELYTKKRPQVRTSFTSSEKMDLLEHLAHQFRVADEAVKKRRSGKFKPANVAFVTFADIASAQIAAQVGGTARAWYVD